MNEIKQEVYALLGHLVALKEELYAVLGSLVALKFMSEGATWARRAIYFLGGWALSKLFGEPIQGVIGTTIEAARGLTALFGLAVVEKAFDVIHSFDAKRLGRSIMARIEKRIKG